MVLSPKNEEENNHIFKLSISFAKAKTALPFVKGKTGGGRFLKICFRKGVATFLNPFRIGVAAFLAIY